MVQLLLAARMHPPAERNEPMSMGRRDEPKQSRIWLETSAVQNGPGHPFYRKLEELLRKHEADRMIEDMCAEFYAEKVGRPSIPPGVYFRLLMIGYFEGIDSERGIAWRVSDSLGLRQFLGYAVDETTPEHSSMSRIRRRIDLETHQKVFTWVLGILAKEKLLKGKTLGVDATTLEANAALRSIVRRDSGEGYDEFLRGLAAASGIETPTRADLARIDKKRPKKGSNKDWKSPSDPDSRITKMKDGRTHLAHKAEQVIDMETNAVVAVTLQHADLGDTSTLPVSLDAAAENIVTMSEDVVATKHLSPAVLSELVADKGYHSGEVLLMLEDMGYRSHVSEPDRGRRNWEAREAERDATYANRRRVRSEYGKAMQRKRGEVLERTHAHLYETGRMRRTHLRHHDNILKRLLVHVCAFNLSLVMRKLTKFGTPRALQGLLDSTFAFLRLLLMSARAFIIFATQPLAAASLCIANVSLPVGPTSSQFSLGTTRSSTGC
jgi:transposase